MHPLSLFPEKIKMIKYGICQNSPENVHTDAEREREREREREAILWRRDCYYKFITLRSLFEWSRAFGNGSFISFVNFIESLIFLCIHYIDSLELRL